MAGQQQNITAEDAEDAEETIKEMFVAVLGFLCVLCGKNVFFTSEGA
jgi:hypothetical protein